MHFQEPDLFAPRPVVTDQDRDLARFRLALLGRQWRTAAELRVATGLTDRRLRALAAQTDDIISGQRGYCLLREATPEEIRHSSSWLISQGQKMIKRGVAQRRAAHHLLSPSSNREP